MFPAGTERPALWHERQRATRIQVPGDLPQRPPDGLHDGHAAGAADRLRARGHGPRHVRRGPGARDRGGPRRAAGDHGAPRRIPRSGEGRARLGQREGRPAQAQRRAAGHVAADPADRAREPLARHRGQALAVARARRGRRRRRADRPRPPGRADRARRGPARAGRGPPPGRRPAGVRDATTQPGRCRFAPRLSSSGPSGSRRASASAGARSRAATSPAGPDGRGAGARRSGRRRSRRTPRAGTSARPRRPLAGS